MRRERRQRVRRRGGALVSAPWRRAPLLLLRSPAVVLAVAGAGLILGATAAATPLFLSSAGNAAQQFQVDDTCEWFAGGSVVGVSQLGGPIEVFENDQVRPVDSLRLFRDRDRAVRAGYAGLAHLGPPVLNLVGSTITATSADGRQRLAVRVLHRTGGLDHVRRVAGGGRDGAWLTEEAATSLGVAPGATIRFVSQTGEASIPVAGIYADLKKGQTFAGPPTRGFWCSQNERFFQPGPLAEVVPPPIVLVERDTYLDLSPSLQSRTDISWEYPLVGRVTLEEGQRLAAELEAVQDRLFPGGRPDPFTPVAFVPHLDSALPGIADRSAKIRDALRGAVLPVAVAGTLVALILVAAAGSYWTDRRRSEVRLLAAKGASPATIGLKALLEMALPALVGGVAGWGLATWLVRVIGPSDLLHPGSLRAGLALTAGLLAVGLAVLGSVAGFQAREATERPVGAPPPSRWRRLPVELALVVLAAVSLQRLQLRGAVAVGGDAPPRVDLLALAFPLLFLTGMMRLAARGIGGVIPRLRSAGRRWPHVAWLAGRRLAASARPALVLMTAAGLSVGVAVYAATLTGSVRATLDAKARTFIGSDVAVTILVDATLPDSLAATKVKRVLRANDGQQDVDVLGVDRATFERAVYWERPYADRGLDDLLGALGPADPADGGTVGAIAVGAGLAGDLTLDVPRRGELGGGIVQLPVHTVATARTFPGVRSLRPLLVVDRAALDPLPITVEEQLWAKGDVGTVVPALRDSGMRFTDQLPDADEVLGTTSFLTTAWTFGFLQALGVLTGCIVVGGLLLYVETRQRSRRVSYVLSRRMGLSRRAHLLSLLLELGAPLLAGCVAGAALALAAARLVYGELDSMPAIAPPPLLRLPLPTLVATAAAVCAVAAAAAWVAQRAADRTRVGEVLRLAR